MKFTDMMNKFMKENNFDELFEELNALNYLGSFFNFMEEAVQELEDNEIRDKFNEIQDLITNKRRELLNKEIKENPQNEK